MITQHSRCKQTQTIAALSVIGYFKWFMKKPLIYYCRCGKGSHLKHLGRGIPDSGIFIFSQLRELMSAMLLF